MLAKVENQQYRELEPLSVPDFVNVSLTLFEDYISEKQLTVTSSMGDALLVNANSFLLETLLHNFLSNAIRHTPAGGQVHIMLENGALAIANSGKQALEKQCLFERFSSASKNKISSGLGLAIIKEIANKYHWQIDYDFEDGFHFFSVEF